MMNNGNMKIIKSQKIAGYKTELSIKAKDGLVFKRFNSTSGVDFAQADQNCYKRADYWLNRVIAFLKQEKSYLDEYEQRHVKLAKITLKEAEEMKKKLGNLIIRPGVEELEL